MKTMLSFMAATMLLIGLSYWGDDVVEFEAREYCAMVHDSKWPDFHHVYKQQCYQDGSVNEEYLHGHR